MPISDEELIAYLLGDATPQQRRLIELQMGVDATLYKRLGQLRLVLGQLDSLQLQPDPPADLFARTMARVDEIGARVDEIGARVDEIGEPAAASTDRTVSEAKLLLASGYTPTSDGRSRRPWDSTALVVCLTLLCCMLLPTVLRARFESRKAQCAHNLQFLGCGLVQLAMADPGQRFPEVSVMGPGSFAGIYAVKLSDAGLLESPSQVQCASLIGCKPFRGEMELNVIPTLIQLRGMDLQRLEVCRRAAGGDYAYSLGVVEAGQPVPPRFEGRSQFAILVDTPILVNGRAHFVAHDGVGANVLYEDGHVSFVSAKCWEDATRDDPFFNLLHAREAGLNKQDACLGPSHFGPVGND